MNSSGLEAKIARLGTRQGAQFPELTQELLALGETAFSKLLQVLQDPEFRQYLWKIGGQAHDGEPIINAPQVRADAPFQIPILDASRYDNLLQINVVYVLSLQSASKQEPVKSVLREALARLQPRNQKPDRADPDSPRGKWQSYLDDCEELELDAIRAFLETLTDTPQGKWLPSLEQAVHTGIAVALTFHSEGMSEKLIEVLEFFLTRGGNIDVDLLADEDYTALHRAAENDNVEQAKWLLSHGANVNAIESRDLTPLMCSLQGDGRLGARDRSAQREIIETLLKNGADTNPQKPNDDSQTLWDCADAEGESLLREFGIRRPTEEN